MSSGVTAEMPSTAAVIVDETAPAKVPRVMTRWERFISTIWDSDYYEKSPAERLLVHKLDCALLTTLTFGWLMKYIDQTNLANAYVSGMKEDLNITGNQYTYMFTIYNAVYCALQIPSNLVVLKVRPSYWLAMCEIGWGIFAFAQAGAQNYQQMYAFRFFVAFFEAGFQPVSYFLLGSWYTRKELGKRILIWFVAGPAGQAFSGYMQAAIYTTLNGKLGLAGWRWLYIVCGCMTIPCGVVLLLFLPDFPTTTKVYFLSEEEKQLALTRCANNGIVFQTGVVNLKTLKRILSRWRFWVLVPTYLFYATGIQAYNYFTIYLKSAGFSVQLTNILPSTTYVIQMPVEYLLGYISDRTGNRFVVCLVPLLFLIMPTTILAVWPQSVGLKIAAFVLNGLTFITHIFYTWLNEICKGDMEERGFLIAATNTLFFAFNAWLPAVIFLQTDGPSFRKGFPTTMASNLVACIMMCVVWRFHKRQLAQEAAADTESAAESSSPIENVDDEKAKEELGVVSMTLPVRDR